MCERYKKRWLESPGPSCLGLILSEWLEKFHETMMFKIWWLPAPESLGKIVKILYSFTRETEWTTLTSLRVFFLNQYKWEWGFGWVVQGRGPYLGVPWMGRIQISENPRNFFVSYCHFSCVHFCGENVCSFNLLQIYQRALYPVRCLSLHWSKIPPRNPLLWSFDGCKKYRDVPCECVPSTLAGQDLRLYFHFFVSCVVSGKLYSPFSLSSHLKKLSSSINIIFNTYYLPISALSTFN